MKSYLKRDKILLKNLIRVKLINIFSWSTERILSFFLIKGAEANRPYEAQSALLRRYFMDLTQSFMIPLVR